MTDEKSTDDIDSLVASSMVKRGELIPTTTEEVLEARSEYEGALPPSLERYQPRGPSSAIAPPRKAAWSALPFVGVVAAVAAAAAILLMTRGGEEIHGEHLGAPSGGPAAQTSAAPAPLAIPQASCEASCCAGAACKTAESAFATCPTERTCIPCQGTDQSETQYRVRLGNVASSSGQSAAAMAELDLCVSIGATPGSPWVCEPAYAPVATMTTDSAASDALEHVPTRLASFEPERQGRLINWGYALCDASLRTRAGLTVPMSTAWPDEAWRKGCGPSSTAATVSE